MKTRKLLDSFALIRFLRREAGSERVKELLGQSARSGDPLLMCELNLGEVYYVIGRERGLPLAEETIALVSTLPIRRVSVTWEMILHAARLKSQHALSYADCMAAACAIAHKAVLITGDREFKAVKHMLPIEWI